MALIGTIRNNGWILIALMSLALGGFILMEIISNVQRNSAGGVNTIGKVNGMEIKRSEFQNYQDLIYNDPKSGNPFQIRSQVWDYFVESSLLREEAEAIGLGVGDEELNDLQYGNNLSPLIVQRYGENGQVNRNYLGQVKQALETGQVKDPRFTAAWSEQQKEIVKQALEDKITDLVTKGIYTPSWQAEMVFRENNERIDFRYVRIPFEKVPDAEAAVTDSDYKKFLDEFPNLYQQTQETRLVNFVALDVVPTSNDTTAAREGVAKLVEGLRTAANDSAFVRKEDGVYDPSYKKKANLPPGIADTLLRVPLGTVVGPYLDGGVWSIAKVLDRKVLADSVRSRHILIREATPQKEKTVDSLLALLNSGRASFDSLARQNSQDQGSAVKGGDVGYYAEGRSVPEYNAILFYTGQKGKIYKVATEFGWHLIEIMDQKFINNEQAVKAVYLSQRVEPSKQTQQAAKDRAMALFQNAKTSEELAKQAAEQGLQVETSLPLKENDFNVGNLGVGEGSRDMVRWAFDKQTEVGDVAKEAFVYRDPAGGYFDTKYVVAALKGIAKAGKANVATLKALPEAETKVKNRKRAEVLISRIKNKGDLAAVAQEFSVTVDTAKQASMMQSIGEPTTLGVAFSLPKGAVSEPIAGNSGVYIIQPLTDKPAVQPPADLTLFKRQANSSTISFVKRELIPSLVRKADVQDNRSKFF